METAPSLTQQEAKKMFRAHISPLVRGSGPQLGSLGAVLLMLCFAAPVVAQDQLEKPPEIPPVDAPQQEPETQAAAASEEPLPPKVQDEEIEPSVTIREEEGRLIEEYSRNGQVYMVRIVPKIGVPYYYIDTDGDGQLETTPNKGLDPVQPVHWKIKEFD